MIKILDRYIAQEFLSVFLFGVIAFSAISAGIGILPNLIGDASRLGLDIKTVFLLFWFRMPQVIVYTFPTAILLAAFQSFGRLSSDSEITAFLASGIPFRRLLWPALIIGFMISILTILFNEAIVPKSNRLSEEIINRAQSTYRPKILTNVSIPEYENGFLMRSINARVVENGVMKDVTILEYTEGVLNRTIHAAVGVFSPNRGWRFYNGIMYLFDIHGQKELTRVKFSEELVNISYNLTDFNVAMNPVDPNMLNYFQLKKHIEIKEKSGTDVLKYKVKLYMKISIPFACVIFTLLGAPLGQKPQRQSNSVGIGLTLLVVIIYYVLVAVSEWLGLAGTLPAILAAWLPNLIIGSAGLIFIYNDRR